MARPFFSIITRHMVGLRPVSYDLACESLWSQTFQDWEHLVIFDEERVGIKAANAMLAQAKPEGRFVVFLDDDDVFHDDTALYDLHLTIANFRSWLNEPYPHMAIARCGYAHGNGIVLPPNSLWGRKPQRGKIGGQCVVASRRVWEQNIHLYGADEFPDDHGGSGDFSFAMGCWDSSKTIAWHNRLLIRQQRVGLGRSDYELGVEMPWRGSS